MDHGLIALLMFSSMMLLLLTGKRVFGAIGFVAAAAALLLWGDGGAELPFSAAMKLMKWYPLLTLPMFVFMGYMLSESGGRMTCTACSTCGWGRCTAAWPSAPSA